MANDLLSNYLSIYLLFVSLWCFCVCICVYMFNLSMSVYDVGEEPTEARREFVSLIIGHIEICELRFTCWELKPDSLREQ